MKHKILFLTSARYPTEKAYGVTTGNTVKALRSIGDEIEIWNPANSGIDEYGNKMVSIGAEHRFNRRTVYNLTILGLNRWFYYLDQFNFSLNCLRKISSESPGLCIWTRFPVACLFPAVNRKVKLVIIELHHQPNFISRLMLKIIKRIKPLKVALISRKAEEQFNLLNTGIPTFTLEMAVPESFIHEYGEPLLSPTTISFLGKSESSGNSNNLEFIFEAFSKMRITNPAAIEIVGLGKTESERFAELARKLSIPSTHLKFIDHLTHSEVGKYLNKISIGLVPYELNKYNAGRFPIKVIEYASKGIWILAPEKFAHHLQISRNIIRTYKDGNSSDLAAKLEGLTQEIRANGRRNPDAIEFAKEHTYKVRAAKLVSQLGSVDLI
jgi:hypothetical protein